jgi:hypothetical protein
MNETHNVTQILKQVEEGDHSAADSDCPRPPRQKLQTLVLAASGSSMYLHCWTSVRTDSELPKRFGVCRRSQWPARIATGHGLKWQRIPIELEAPVPGIHCSLLVTAL